MTNTGEWMPNECQKRMPNEWRECSWCCRCWSTEALCWCYVGTGMEAVGPGTGASFALICSCFLSLFDCGSLQATVWSTTSAGQGRAVRVVVVIVSLYRGSHDDERRLRWEKAQSDAASRCGRDRFVSICQSLSDSLSISSETVDSWLTWPSACDCVEEPSFTVVVVCWRQRPSPPSFGCRQSRGKSRWFRGKFFPCHGS